MADIEIDSKSFKSGAKKLGETVKGAQINALSDIAYEVLRLSSFEVPHDTGMLQSSGTVESEIFEPMEVIVGYNKVYAARLHEHPEYHFQKGRKGKYLEDPIKNNLRIFREFYQKSLSSIF